jgi:hypothetical protein
MTIVDYIAEEFKKTFHDVYNKEKDDPKYLNQNWLGSRWRAFKGIAIAVIKSQIIFILAYAITKHRVEAHRDKKQSTLTKLSAKLGDEKVNEINKTQSGWIS